MSILSKIFGKGQEDGEPKVYQDREFKSVYDGGGRTFSHLEFRRCRFWSCGVSITKKPARRSTVRDVKLIHCEQLGCAIDTAIIEDVVVDGLKTGGQVLQTWGAVFKHVTLKGAIDQIMISPLVATGMAKPHEQRAFDEANAAYYAEVDWALDISQARFKDCDLRGVPARLVRRDPETQVVVTREQAQLGKWRKLDLSGTHWQVSIEFLLRDGYADVVLVAPKRDRKYKVLLEGLQKLRDAGVAEPDYGVAGGGLWSSGCSRPICSY